MRTYEEAMQAYKAECDEISEDCVNEGYPSHGSNYDLRVEGIKEYYPEIFNSTRVMCVNE